MRISIVKGDRGYDPGHTRRVKRVTIDGLPVACATADEEEGFVDELMMEDGRIKLDPTDGSPLTRRMVGAVKVELMPEEARAWDNARTGEAKVRVGREPGTGDILVQVYSIARPGAIKQGRLPLKAHLGRTQASLCQAAGTVGGAMAEMLCEQFGDRIDPSAAARAATEQCFRLLTDER